MDKKITKIVEDFSQRWSALDADYFKKGTLIHEQPSAEDWLRTTLSTALAERDKEIMEVKEEALSSFCIMVKNELRQQKLDGFSLDGTDFDAVFESAKKMIINTNIKALLTKDSKGE